MTARECTVRRYVHGEGITQFATSPDGKHVITCGGDSDVRTFEDIDDDSVAEFSVASDRVTSIVCWWSQDQELKVAIATDDHTVQAYTYLGSSDGILVRFTAPVNHMSVNKANTLLAAGSSDFQIKIVSLKDYVMIGCFTDHVAPVLTVQFDPVGEFLASSCCDGTFKLWGITSQTCVASLKVLVMANDMANCKSLCRLAWKPHGGKALAVPVESEVKIYERLSWKTKYSLKDDYHQKGVNVVCWSHDASCLAVGGVDGHMSIWNYSNQQLCLKLRNEENVSITCIAFHLIKKDCMMFADKEGYIGSFESALSTNKSANEIKDSGYNEAEDYLMEGITHDDLFNDDVVDHDYNDEISDMASSSKDEVPVDSTRPPYSNISGLEQRQKSAASGRDDASVSLSEDRVITKSAQLQLSDDYFNSYQDAFQSSETPRHLQHRFMAYNLVGIVFGHDEDDGSALIEVEFHDIGIHHSFSIANHDGYTMASLSEVALVLASEATEDGPSMLHCVHFNTWDSSKDWTLPLPAKESIKAVALGDDWIAIASNLNMLRLFSVGGIQKNILCLPGPVIAMAACKQKLSVAYSSLLCTPKSAMLYLWELDVKKREQLVPPNHPLPLSNSAQLTWIGYSTDGMLISVDSRGIVRGLCTSFGTCWTPLLDMSNTLAKKTDTFFVIGITCDPYEIKCIHCKGLPYPPTYPRPVMMSLPICLPLCNPSVEKTKFEEELLLSQLQMSADKDTSFTAQALMKLFALSCKNGKFYRAVEVAEMLPTTQSLQLALTYASRTGNAVIADRINDIISCRENLPSLSDDEESSCDEDTMQHSSVTSSRRKQDKISSSSVRLLKNLPSSYKRSGSFKEKPPAVKNDVYDQQTDMLSDDGYGPDNDFTSESHEQEATPTNTLQLFDDDDDNGVAEKSVPTSKYIKPTLASQTAMANPFKVTNTHVSSVEPLKKRTSFLESITTSAVEEANTKSRKRQSSDSDTAKVKKSKSSISSSGKKSDKKVQQSLKSFAARKGHLKIAEHNSQSMDSSQVTSTVEDSRQSSKEMSQAETDKQEDADHTDSVPDSASLPVDCDDNDPNQQLSSKEKLAKFSFEHKT